MDCKVSIRAIQSNFLGASDVLMLGLPKKNISEVDASGPSQFLFTVSYVLFCFYFILGSRFSQNWALFTKQQTRVFVRWAGPRCHHAWADTSCEQQLASRISDFEWQRQNFSLGHMEEGKKHQRMRRGMRHRSSKHPILIAQELA